MMMVIDLIIRTEKIYNMKERKKKRKKEKENETQSYKMQDAKRDYFL